MELQHCRIADPCCRLLAVDLELGGCGRQLGELREGDREHSVLELGVGVGHVGGLGQADTSLHGAVGALERVVLVGVRFVSVFALGLHDEHVALDGQVEVLGTDAGKVGQHLELIVSLDQVAGEQWSKGLGEVVGFSEDGLAGGEELVAEGVEDLPGVQAKGISGEVVHGTALVVRADGSKEHLGL